DFAQLIEEPGIDFGEAGNLSHTHATLEGVAEIAEALRLWRDEHLREAAPVFLPVSSERQAFISASLKVRPMAITSPTDFICGPRVSSAPGNFSNCHLGILTTT